MARRYKKYSKEELEDAIIDSGTWAEVAIALGATPMSGSQSHFRHMAQKYGISFAHFKGRSWSKGISTGPVRPLGDYITNKFPIKSSNLRDRLVKEGIKEDRCEECGLSQWMGVKICLELDHTDSNHFNNSLDNLRIVCPNCHATLTFLRRKLIQGNSKAKERVKSDRFCLACGGKISYKAKSCMACRPTERYKKPLKIEWPDIEILLDHKRRRKIFSLSRQLGVSDSAILKRIKKLTTTTERQSGGAA